MGAITRTPPPPTRTIYRNSTIFLSSFPTATSYVLLGERDREPSLPPHAPPPPTITLVLPPSIKKWPQPNPPDRGYIQGSSLKESFLEVQIPY